MKVDLSGAIWALGGVRKAFPWPRIIRGVGRRKSAAGRFFQAHRFSQSAHLQFCAAGSFSVDLLTRLERRLSDGKEGHGYEMGSPVVATARAAFTEALTSLYGHHEHLAPETIATEVCDHYHRLSEWEERRAFFAVLAGDLGVEHDNVATSAQKLIHLHTQNRSEATLLKSEEHLRQVLRPFYRDLFSLIARLEGGIKFLVDFRGGLLETIAAHPDHTAVHLLAEMNSHLREILAQWFSVQLLDLQNITWESPCDIMEKISQYEAVHPLRHWKDLKHRVGPNRRCFIFTHRAIPREPIMVLHAALTSQPSSSIQVLLNRTLQENPENVNTAVFYSISATQRGLSGVELGNFLIRRVVQELQHEFPDRLRHFVTLSPIPGFRRWLDSHLKLHSQLSGSGSCLREKDLLVMDVENCRISENELEEVVRLVPGCKNHIHALQIALSSTMWVTEPHNPLALALQRPLTSLCARYLVLERRRGRALDPVAHFHLLNGAFIWRLNWLADTSPNGLQRSHGLMVNYRYHLPEIGRNSDAYRTDTNQMINYSSDVEKYL